MAKTTSILLLCVLLSVVQSFLIQLPDTRMLYFEFALSCDPNNFANLRCRYRGPAYVFVSFKQLICADDSVPFSSKEDGYDVIDIYYPQKNSSQIFRPCIFNNPIQITLNGVEKHRYTVYLSMLWSDGYPAFSTIYCDVDIDFFTRTSTQIPPTSPEPEPEPEPEPDTTPTPEPTTTPEPETTTPETTTPEPSPSTTPQPRPPPHNETTPVPIKATCGKHDNATGSAQIHIITDKHVSAIGYCHNNTMIDFYTNDTVNLYLDVFYNTSFAAEGKCVFPNTGTASYSLQIEIWEGERYHRIHTSMDDIIVTCSFDDLASAKTVDIESFNGTLNKPNDIAVFSGVRSDSLLLLEPVDVLHRPITTTYIPMGRTILLRGITNGSHGEVGLRPVSCDVVGSTGGQKYAILRSGCGDGIIFPKDAGFVTDGLITISPYFTTFAMSLNTRVGYQCSFILCTEECDGSSCDPDIFSDD